MHSLRPIRVAQVLRHLQASTIPERDISVTLEVDESLHVSADETLLTSAVSHLLHNACKFSCDGAQVTVTCRCEEHGVVIEVEDECGGLAPTALSDLFGLFVNGADYPQHVGRGLGITKTAAEAMAGRVYVENRPGQGCSFSLVFPLVVREHPSSTPPTVE